MITFYKFGNFGRLGNQMFQYAALKAAAETSGCFVALPLENNDLINCFNISAKLYSLTENKNVLIGVKQYTEQTFHYDEKFKNIQQNTNLEGYFQSEKYFSNIVDTIRKEYTFKKKIFAKASNFIQDIREKTQKNIVSIHIRRTDYLNLQQFHPICTREYYNTAITKFDNHHFIIFSDDIEWCKVNLIAKNYSYSSLSSHYEDLCAMSLCDHNIIANSSFSWWGAWLNNNKNKNIIAPKKWFGPAYSDKKTDDLYCDRWSII